MLSYVQYNLIRIAFFCPFVFGVVDSSFICNSCVFAQDDLSISVGQYQSQNIIHGLGIWRTHSKPTLTTEDSIWVDSSVSNHSGRSLQFSANDYCDLVTITLDGPGENDSRLIQLKSGEWLQSFAYQRHVEPNKVLHSFRVDIRGLFGKLKPGSYTVLFSWDASKFKISGLEALDALKSSHVKFQINRANLKLADRSPLSEVVYRLIESNVDETNQVTSKITNTFKSNIFLPLVSPQHLAQKDDQPLLLRSDIYRFGSGIDIRSSNSNEGNSFESHLKDKSRLYALAPGKSIEVTYPKCDGDGIFSYSHWILVGNDIDRSQPAKINSNWFQIERFKKNDQ